MKIPLLISLFVLLCQLVFSKETGDASFTNTEEDIIEFNKWFTHHYEKESGTLRLEVRRAQAGGGFGVYATSKIPAEYPYLKIPMKLLMNEQQMVATTQLADPIRRSGLTHTHSKLAIFLMYEKFVTKERSFWYPYIKTLPSLMDTPAYYTPYEVAELQGTGLQEKLTSEQMSWKNSFRKLKDKLFDENKELFPRKLFTWENYKWAQSIVSTRTIWAGGHPNLIPFLDMINCKEGIKNPERVHQTLQEGTFATTYSPWEFLKDDEVFENYGQKNSIYFLHHGFSIQGNSHDCLDVQPALPNVILKYVKAQGINPREEYCVKPRDVPDNLMRVLRILGQEPEERESYKGDYKTRMSYPVEMRAFDSLIDIAHDLLELHPTTPKENRLILKDVAISFRYRMIVSFRLSQKNMAFKIVQWAEGIAHGLHIAMMQEKRDSQ